MASNITVGFTTLFTSVEDPDELQKLAQRMVDSQLAEAQAAYHDGNRSALQQASRLLQEHRPHDPWPTWVLDGLVAELHRPLTKKRGRHAQEKTSRRDHAVDCVRATFIDCYLIRNTFELLSKDPATRHRVAAKAVSERLGGDAGGTTEVMHAAYTRFCRRVKETPALYYPLLEWRGQQILNALIDTPVPQNSPK